MPAGRHAGSAVLQAQGRRREHHMCVLAVARDPVVLPFYHSGMAAVMPEHGRIPRVGKHVTVTVGEPVPVSDLTCGCRRKGEQLKEAGP